MSARGYAAVAPGGQGVLRLTSCRSCQASVFFARTPDQKWMILDEHPDPAGKYVVSALEPNIRCEPFRADDARHDGFYRFAPHWSTCTRPNDWRKN